MYNPLLTTFTCVADCGSFNKAAEKLFISPPSVMKQINTLEKHLDLRLFSRNNQGIQLTPAGQVIYRYAKQIFHDSAQALTEAHAAAARQETTFRIGSSILNPCKPFMDLWYQVNHYFPGHKLQIVPFEDAHENILSVISSLGDRFDFLVGVCDSILWMNRCQFLPLGTFEHYVAVPRSHPLAKKKRLTLQDLYGETLMMVKQGDSAIVDRIRSLILQHSQITIEDTSQFYDINVFNYCEQSGHILLTPECWQDVHPALVALPVNWNFPIPYGLLYALEPSDEVAGFIETVRRELAIPDDNS